MPTVCEKIATMDKSELPFSHPSRNISLHMAIMDNDEETVRFLLKQGANVNGRLRAGQNSSSLNRNNKIKPVEKFLTKKRNKFKKSKLSKKTVNKNQIIESGSEHQCTADSFINNYLYCDDGNANKSPMPLHIAISHKKLNLVKLLLEYGADVDADVEGDYTPLMVSVLMKRYDFVELLIRWNAKVNLSNATGRSALYYAAKTRQLDMVRLLLRSGADPNVRTDNGVTPLHVAVERKLPDMVEVLIINGSDVNAMTKTGVTPMHCAAARGSRDISEILLDFGADLNLLMKKGKLDISPLLWVSEAEKMRFGQTVMIHITSDRKTKSSLGSTIGKFWKKLSNK